MPADSVATLTGFPDLEGIWLAVEGAIDDISPFLEFPALKNLYLYSDRLRPGLGFLSRLPRLSGLGLGGVSEERDFSPLMDQPEVKHLVLHRCPGLTDPAVLTPLGAVKTLYLWNAGLGDAYWSEIALTHPRLTRLIVQGDGNVTDLPGIARLPLASVR